MLGWALVLGLMAAGMSASATRLVMLSLEELARGAEAVVHGKVVAVGAQKDAEGRVYTKVELVLEDVWKGKMSGNTCVLVHGGGTLGEVEVRASGQASFSVGDELVAYLTRSAKGEWITVGLSQGRFQVSREETTGRRWVRNGFWGGSGEVTRARAMAWPLSRPLGLEELKRRTQEVAP